MKENYSFNYLSTLRLRQVSRRLTALAAAMLVCSLFATAQDASVVPANDNSKVPWVNDVTHFSTVTATGAGWSNLDRIYNTNTADYATHTSSGAGTKTTSVVSVSNGQTFITKPFTGYWVGAVVARNLQIGTVINILSTNKINMSVYNDNVLIESKEFDWAALTDSDVGFYVHQQFDEVRIQLTSSITGIGASIDQRIKQVYFQRYTRFGGGVDNVGDKEVTCNAQIPLTGLGLDAEGEAFTIVAGVPVYVPASLWPGLVSAMTDTDPDSHGNIPYITLGGATYKGSITDLAVVYPAGTLGGAVYNLTGAFATGVLQKKLNFYLDNTLVHSVDKTEIFNASVGGDFLVAGDISPVPFNRIQYEINMYLTAGAGNVEAFYPIVQRFCDAPVACTNEPVSLINGVQATGVQNHPVYANSIGTSVVNVSVGDPGIANSHRVTDSDLDNYATIGDVVAGGQVYSNYGISVVSRQTGGYPAGTFAGYEIQEDDWADATFAKKYIISTYKSGAEVEHYSNQDFAGVDFFTPNKGRHIIGFRTSASFDEVRISVEKIITASGLSATKVYRAVIQEFCPTVFTDLADCNEVTSLKNSNGFPVYIDSKNTGIVGVATANAYFEDLDNIIGNTASPAKLFSAVGATTTASVAVQDGSKSGADLYPKGTFAGFDVAFPTLVSGQLLGTSVTVSLLDPSGAVIHSEVMSSSFFGAHSSVLSGTTSRQIIGYAAPVPFSGVKLTVNKNASVDFGTLEIYSAVIERFCAGVVDCAAIDQLRNPEHGVYINGKNTGVNALADGNSTIANSQNAIDANATNYATIQLGATVGAEVGFSVANGIYNMDGTKYHYPAQTYVGFDIETQNWFDVGGLYQTQIQLYRDGALVQSSSGDQLGAGVSSSLVTGGWQRQILGTVAYTTFDEVRLVSSRVAGVSVGEMRIYDFVARNFDPATATACVVNLECNETIPLTDGNGTDHIPAVVEFDRTGFTAVGAAGYGIEDAWNVVTPSVADYATIHAPLSGVYSASISVAAPGKVFPSGTYAGFTVDKEPFIISGAAFAGVTVTTYLNGVQQEQKTDGALLDFTLLTQWFGTPATVYNPGFKATLPFNEVQITISALGQVADQQLHVYGAYIDTRESTPTPGDGSTPIACAPDLKPSIVILPSVTYGNQSITVRVQANEVAGVNTSGLITMNVKQSSNWTIGIAPGTVTGIWTYVGVVGVNHRFTTSSVIEASTFSRINIPATFNPLGNAGQYVFTVSILSNSGGETNNTNNSDQETITFNP